MADYIQSYPYPADTDPALANHMNTIVDSINALGSQMSLGGGDVVENADAATGRVTVDGNLVRYLYRYIHYRVTEDQAGETLADLSTFAGNSIFVGVNNSSDPTTPGSAYQYAEFVWGAGNNLFYRAPGQGNIAFSTSTSFELEAADRVLTNTGVVDTGIGTAAMGIVQRAHVTGTSRVGTSTVGGDAVILTSRTPSADRSNTNVIINDFISRAGTYTINFNDDRDTPRAFFIAIAIGTTVDTYEADFDWTFEVTELDGTVVSSVTLTSSHTINVTSPVFASADIPLADIPEALRTIAVADSNRRVQLTFTFTQTGTSTNTLNISRIDPIADPFVLVDDASFQESVAHITSNNPALFATEIAGGFGLNVPKILAFSGSTTAISPPDPIFNLNDAPFANALIFVQWVNNGNDAAELISLYATDTTQPAEGTGTTDIIEFYRPILNASNQLVCQIRATMYGRGIGNRTGRWQRFEVDTTNAEVSVSPTITSIWYTHST